MRVYEASTLISAEFGGIRDLSRHLSLNLNQSGDDVKWMHRLIMKNIVRAEDNVKTCDTPCMCDCKSAHPTAAGSF